MSFLLLWQVRGLLFIAVVRLLIAVASRCRACTLGHKGLVALRHMESSRTRNLCPLWWQADSYSLPHQGSPAFFS